MKVNSKPEINPLLTISVISAKVTTASTEESYQDKHVDDDEHADNSEDVDNDIQVDNDKTIDNDKPTNIDALDDCGELEIISTNEYEETSIQDVDKTALSGDG